MTGNNSSWLKDNFFIVAAIALPLVVIAFFLAATGIPRFLVDDPQYDMLFATRNYGTSDYVLNYRVVDGKLMADARLASRTEPRGTLYRYDASTLDVIEIATEVPESVVKRLREQQDQKGANQPVAPTTESFEVAETAALTLLRGNIAPDGYEFRDDRHGNRGLFGDLFGMGSRNRGFSVARDGRVILIRTHDDNRYRRSATLLGWVEQ